MKISHYPKVSKLSCDKCGAEFELNKFDLRKNKMFSDKRMGELCIQCPICKHEHYLSSFESNLRSFLYGKIYHVLQNASNELRDNKQKYTKETAVLLNKISEEILDAVNTTDVELGEEIVLEEDDDYYDD